MKALRDVFGLWAVGDWPVFQQEVFGSFKDVFVGLGGFGIFDVSYFADDANESAHPVKQVEDDREGKRLCGEILKEMLNLANTGSYEIPGPPVIQNDSLKSEFLERVREIGSPY